MDCFDNIPIACILNGRFLAVHGGISPKLNSALDINKVHRVKEPPLLGELCDLLWADPVDNESGMQ